jgi:hypothetical protein
MTLYLTDNFSTNMLWHGRHILTFRTISEIEAADLLYVHEFQTVNALDPKLTRLVEMILRKELVTLLLSDPKPTAIKLTQYDSLLIVEYTGPALEGEVEQLPPEASVRFWFADLPTEFRYRILTELVLAYGEATQSFRKKLGMDVKLPFRPASDKEKEEVMFWHWQGLVEIMRKAVELGARPVETLEAVSHIHRTLW